MNCGNFSQVVWVGTRAAGFGCSRAADGTVYVVGHYSPAGNFVGQWPENVLPPRDGRSDLLDVPAPGMLLCILCKFSSAYSIIVYCAIELSGYASL